MGKFIVSVDSGCGRKPGTAQILRPSSALMDWLSPALSVPIAQPICRTSQRHIPGMSRMAVVRIASVARNGQTPL
jgi:hypothetical protein